MFELLFAVVIVSALGVVAGVVAAFTHQALITKFVATVKVDVEKAAAFVTKEGAAAASEIKKAF